MKTYKEIKNTLHYIIPEYCWFELINNENNILSILILCKSWKRQLEKALEVCDYISLEKNKKKTVNGLNQFMIRFKNKLD